MTETWESLRLLLERGMLDAAYRTLELALEAARTQAAQCEVLELFAQVPAATRLSSSAWITLSCRLFCVADDRGGLRALLEQVPITEDSAFVYRAWSEIGRASCRERVCSTV